MRDVIGHLLKAPLFYFYLLSCVVMSTGCEGGKPNSQVAEPAPVGDNGLPSIEAEQIMKDPLVIPLLSSLFDAQSDINASGAVGANQRGRFESVRWQGEGAYYAIALAVANLDRDLFKKGVLALELGLSRQNDEGAFQDDSKQATFRFAVFGLRACRLALQSPYATASSKRLDSIQAGLARTGSYLLSILPEHREIYESANQVAWLGYTFITLGQLNSNKAMVSQGEALIEEVLHKQRRDGAFLEKGGHDSHYQSATLMALATLILHSESSSQRTQVLDAIADGVDWLESRISQTGRVGDEGNTRTAHDPANSSENKQIDPREVALALLYSAHLSDALFQTRSTVELIATRIGNKD